VEENRRTRGDSSGGGGLKATSNGSHEGEKGLSGDLGEVPSKRLSLLKASHGKMLQGLGEGSFLSREGGDAPTQPRSVLAKENRNCQPRKREKGAVLADQGGDRDDQRGKTSGTLSRAGKRKRNEGLKTRWRSSPGLSPSSEGARLLEAKEKFDEGLGRNIPFKKKREGIV